MEMNKARRVKDYLVQAGAIAGALAAILGLVFLLFPKLKPTVPEAPKKRVVALSDVQVEQRGYREKSGFYIVAVHFRCQVDGYLGTTLPVRYRLVNADTGHPYDVPRIGRHGDGPWPGAPTTGFTPTAESEALPGEVEVEIPFTGPSWKVQLEIHGPDEKRLDAIETPSFKVAPRKTGE